VWNVFAQINNFIKIYILFNNEIYQSDLKSKLLISKVNGTEPNLLIQNEKLHLLTLDTMEFCLILYNTTQTCQLSFNFVEFCLSTKNLLYIIIDDLLKEWKEGIFEHKKSLGLIFLLSFMLNELNWWKLLSNS